MNYKNNKNNKKKIIEELLHESDMEMTDEELIGEILSTKVTENYEKTEKVSFGQKARGRRCPVRRKLGVHFQFRRHNDYMDDS